MGYRLSDYMTLIYWFDGDSPSQQNGLKKKKGIGKILLHVYLEVILGIPVRIKDDAGISSSKINA